MPAHKHAALMLQYAQDALESEEPWLLWEYQHCGHSWSPLIQSPYWVSNYEYRRKPKYIRIGEYDVPEPLRVAPKNDTPFYTPQILGDCVLTYKSHWSCHHQDQLLLQKGLVHLTKEDAELHAKALISLTAGPTRDDQDT